VWQTWDLGVIIFYELAFVSIPCTSVIITSTHTYIARWSTTMASGFASTTPRQHLPAIPPSVLPKLVLLDRDGVVNEDVGSPGITDVSKFCLTPRAGSAIGRLRRYSFHVALITNQSCVGKGLLTEGGLNEIHEEMRKLLLDEDDDASFDALYCCLSRKEEQDPRMKPGCGMILEAMSDFEVRGTESVFIGDTLTDLQAAKAGGVDLRILLETGFGKGLMGGQPALEEPVTIKSIESRGLDIVTPFVYARNLDAAATWLCGNRR